jgi:hypothetical protein
MGSSIGGDGRHPRPEIEPKLGIASPEADAAFAPHKLGETQRREQGSIEDTTAIEIANGD